MKNNVYEVMDSISDDCPIWSNTRVFNLTKLVNILEYANIQDFLSDHPAAVQSILEYIQRVESTEWDTLTKKFVVQDEYGHEEAE